MGLFKKKIKEEKGNLYNDEYIKELIGKLEKASRELEEYRTQYKTLVDGLQEIHETILSIKGAKNK